MNLNHCLYQHDDVEEVVVTGTRIKSTFTSISPLQIISAETSREIGLIDATSILQEAPASSTAN